MRERPIPPSSIGDQDTLAHLHYELARQLRESDGSSSTVLQVLRSMLREQAGKENFKPSAYIEHLLESLDDNDITPELFLHALDLPEYAPTDANGALRPEDDDPSDT